MISQGGQIMKSYNSWIQHIANPLHVYCRLVDFGMSTRFSRRLSTIYERCFYHLLIRDLKQHGIRQ